MFLANTFFQILFSQEWFVTEGSTDGEERLQKHPKLLITNTLAFKLISDFIESSITKPFYVYKIDKFFILIFALHSSQ